MYIPASTVILKTLITGKVDVPAGFATVFWDGVEFGTEFKSVHISDF